MITAHSKKWGEDLNAEILYVNALNGESLFSSNSQWREVIFVLTEILSGENLTISWWDEAFS